MIRPELFSNHKLEFRIVNACSKDLLDSVMYCKYGKLAAGLCAKDILPVTDVLKVVVHQIMSTRIFFSFVNINKAQVNTLSPTNHTLH